jgi:hypothetical protein
VFDGFTSPEARLGWLLRLTADKHGIRNWSTVAVRMDADGTPSPDTSLATPCGRRGNPHVRNC